MAENRKKGSRLTLKRTLVMYALIPLSVGLIILGTIAAVILTQSIEANIREELVIASSGLMEYYTFDLETETNLVDGFCAYDPEEYIDKIAKNTGIDLTLFRDNVRFMTSIIGPDGKRIEGTEASAEVWNTIKAGNDYYSDDVVINGIDYYVYYLPIVIHGDLVGMAFSGKPATSVRLAEKELYFTIIGIVVVLETLFLIMAMFISRKISAPIIVVKEGIEKLSNGIGI
ncbi:MAG: cache domain-containing protein [Lachnospiraceae bacterium]|nr:cache domain-containing protein [Lachnospiraceae bacterium]